MAQDTFEDIRTDVLDRSGATTDEQADYLTTVERQILRTNHELCNHHPYLFLRKNPPGAFNTVAPLRTGTVLVTANNVNITFSSAPSVSVAGRKILIDGMDEPYRIATHVAAQQAATLDVAFNGVDAAAATYVVYQDEYDLATDLRHIVEMVVAEDGTPIHQRTEAFILEKYGRAFETWPPSYFVRIGEQRIRFSGYPQRQRRIEYAYTIIPPDLVAGVTPIVPRNWRYVLSDGALYWTYIVRNDNRADAAGILYAGGRNKLVEDDLRKRMELSAWSFNHGAYR